MSTTAVGQELQDVAALLPTGCHHRQNVGHEPATAFSVRTVTHLPPLHGVPQGPLDAVVRRLDPLDPDESPQARLQLEDLLTHAGGLGAAAGGAALQRSPHV